LPRAEGLLARRLSPARHRVDLVAVEGEVELPAAFGVEHEDAGVAVDRWNLSGSW